MNTKVGLWIDHKKASIVTLSDKGEEIGSVVSNTERQPRRTNGKPVMVPHDSHQMSHEEARDRAYHTSLNRYYDAIISGIYDAESILIFGPAEAKDELRKRLEQKGLGRRVVGVEAAARMTPRQISAKVRRHFATWPEKRVG